MVRLRLPATSARQGSRALRDPRATRLGAKMPCAGPGGGTEMRAAVVESGTVVIREVPRPQPGPEDVLVELATAGVCHSDLHLARGDWPGWGRSDGPMPLGHEGVGTLVELGPGADR